MNNMKELSHKRAIGALKDYMENENLLKTIENLLDKKLEKKLQPIINETGDLKKGQEEIIATQKSILNFISQADTEFMKLVKNI